MPLTITKTTTLRNRDIPPLKDIPDLDPAVASSLARIGSVLRTHPALRSRSVANSSDGLTKTTTTVWDSRPAYSDFVMANSADLARIASAAAAYNQANGITVTTAVTGD